MKCFISLVMVLFPLLVTSAKASVRRYANDYSGFLADVGLVSMIDFETLPDGSPSHSGTHITGAFNYDVFGAHFTTSNGTLYVEGNATSGFGLGSVPVQPLQASSIIVDLSSMGYAVGAFFPGGTTLSTFDANGTLLGSVSFSAGGGGFFVGIVSDVPIAQARFGPGIGGESIDSFVFTPIPEPATLGLALFGAFLLKKRRC